MPVISATTHRMECDRPCRACGLIIQRDTVGFELAHKQGKRGEVWYSVRHRECHAELAKHGKVDDHEFAPLCALPASAEWRAFYERERIK